MGDPSIAVRILQIANSAYFGRPYGTLDVVRIFSLLAQNRLGKEREAPPTGNSLPAGMSRQL